MGNPQHLEWLLEGVEAWNARREREEFSPDLSGESLRGMNLESANFEDANLRTADLQETILTHACLVRAYLGGADLQDADLAFADLEGANLRGANFGRADLWGASLEKANLRDANLGGAVLSTANLQGASLRNTELWNAYARSVKSSDDANGVRAYFTDLSFAKGLTQSQLNRMAGDSGTIIPDHLTRPTHWPEFAFRKGEGEDQGEPLEETTPKDRGSEASAPPEAADQDELKHRPVPVRSSDSLQVIVRQRSASELRASLQESYSEPAALAAYMVAQLQHEIAAQKMTAIPNQEPELSQYNARLNFLEEMRASVQIIHEHLPLNVAPVVTEEDAATIREKLVALAGQVQTAIKWLDDNTGTAGNLWKMGIIGLSTSLFTAIGFPVATVMPIIAGVVGVNTLRVIVQRKP